MLKKTAIFFIIVMLLVSGLSACAKQAEESANDAQANASVQNKQYVSGRWHIDSPANHAVNEEKLANFYSKIEDKPILSVLIVRDGSVISEYYKDGYDENSVFILNSCTKSVTSALVGIAIDKGYLEGIDTKITAFFPELEADEEQTKKDITIEHLLNMTSGLDWPEWTSWNGGFGNWLESENWVDFALEREMTSAPGEVFVYNTGGCQILSAIIKKATGQTGQVFANKYLFEPLGMQSVVWFDDPQGVTLGGFGIQMSARDAARFGQLYVNKGKWGDDQIIPEDWVTESTKMQSGGHHWYSVYGYLWWKDTVSFPGAGKRYDMHYAMGHAGQYIFVVPELDFVTVITSKFSGNETPLPLTYFKSDIMNSIISQ